MQTKASHSLFKFFSMLLVLSLIFSACVPANPDFLSGTGGGGEAETQEAPTEEAIPTEESPTDEPPTEVPTEVPPTDTLEATSEPTLEVTPTSTNALEPTPTATPGVSGLAVSTPTETPLPPPTNTLAPDPYIGLGVACNNDLSATFKITNYGGPLTGGSYTLSEPGKSPVTSPLDLSPGGSVSFKAAGNATVTVNYSTSQLEDVNLEATGTCLPLPTNTPVATSTPSRTPTVTRTPSPTNTPGPSPTPTVTRTPTATRTATLTRTPTSTITPGPSPTPTPSRTPRPTRTPQPTNTPTSTITPGPSPTPTATRTPTETRTPTQTRTPSLTPTITNTPSLTPTIQILDGQLDLAVLCNTDLSATFIISNISGAVSNGSFDLSEPKQSGPVDLQPGDSTSIKGAGYATMTVTYSTSLLSSVTLSVTGSCLLRPTATPTFTPTSTPTNTPMPPSLTASGVCTGTAIGSATFVITNNGGNMTSPYTYEIEDDNGNVVDTGTFQLGAGASTIINVSGSSTTYTLSSPDDSNVSADADTTRCAPPPPPPSLSAVGACSSNAGEAMFIITNNGGNMSAPYTYDIEDDNGNVVDTGTFQLQAGQSTNIKVGGSSMTYTLTSPDDGSLNATADLSTCVQPPSLSVSGACTSTSGIATFVVTNSGGDMTSAYPYEITDDNGNVVQSSTFQLSAGQSASFTIGGSSSSYTFASPNDSSLTATADMTTCAQPPSSPALSAAGVCTSNEGEVRFVITNTGADMSTPYTYEITDANGNVVQSASFQLMSGQSVVVVVSGSSTLYTLSSPDDSGLTAQADTSTCIVPPPPPALTATGLCIANSEFASFIITNGGGDMTVAEVYTVTDADGNVVQTGSFQLKAGQSLSFKVDGSGGELVLSIAGAGGLNVRVASTNCYEPVLSVAPAGSSICIQCLVFHTFRDDNLEIYRLDGIEGQEGFELFNLSKSEAVDSRPSRSPNDSWVVFQSNRDGNVELYYTDLSGSGNPIKLTNSPSTVNNINPMYGPDSKTVVFQSDRGGRFDLFTIDQESGEEVQITSDPADDINPFYSPDLKRLVFQSNRNGNWDIFVLDVETGNEFQLTDSLMDETFPAWSPNGKQIAYLVNVDGATDLYVIDLETRETKRITIDGRTNNHVWSPEGNRIAYQSERNGNLDVYTYDFMTNEEYRVTDYEGPDSGPTWDCGGVNLAFTSIRDGDANIFQVFWKGGAAGNMTIDPATDKWSQWRPSNDVSSTGY